MKKTILKITMLASIASLAMSGYVSAHHMSSDNMPDDQYYYVDSIISDQHNEIIDAMNEDDDLMGSTSRGTDGGEPTMADGVGANENTTSTMSMTSSDSQSVVPAGRGDGMSTRTSSGR